jgi:hypothetical protein
VSARSDGIQRLLATLNKHSDIVSEAFSGPVSGGDRQREQAIAALVSAGVLKDYEEGTYYLSASLHSYFSTVLSSFHALQALTRIKGLMHQANEQWDELRRLRASGSSIDIRRLEVALERSIIEVGDVVERNIALLNAMVMGQYGNVKDMASKFRQNRFYAREVATSLQELRQVEAFVEKVSQSVVGDGLARIRQLVIRRLGAELLPWASRLQDAQASISRRLFDARLMARRLRQLARYSSWLTSNPTEGGWDVEVTESVDPALCRPEGLQMRPQPDFHDPGSTTMDSLVALVRRLPKQLVASRKPLEPRSDDDVVISDEMPTYVAPLKPHEAALARLGAELDSRAADGNVDSISLVKWKLQAHDTIPGMAELDAEVWLFHAAMHLTSRDYRFHFCTDPADKADPFPENTRFYDIEVAASQRNVIVGATESEAQA